MAHSPSPPTARSLLSRPGAPRSPLPPAQALPIPPAEAPGAGGLAPRPPAQAQDTPDSSQPRAHWPAQPTSHWAAHKTGDLFASTLRAYGPARTLRKHTTGTPLCQSQRKPAVWTHSSRQLAARQVEVVSGGDGLNPSVQRLTCGVALRWWAAYRSPGYGDRSRQIASSPSLIAAIAAITYGPRR